MLTKLHEIDLYLTDSDDDSDDSMTDHQPNLAQKEFNNFLLCMGQLLIAAAKENLVPSTTDPPRITL